MFFLYFYQFKEHDDILIYFEENIQTYFSVANLFTVFMCHFVKAQLPDFFLHCIALSDLWGIHVQTLSVNDNKPRQMKKLFVTVEFYLEKIRMLQLIFGELNFIYQNEHQVKHSEFSQYYHHHYLLDLCTYCHLL